MQFNGFMNKSREFFYSGKELDLFALAKNWKSYLKHEIGEYLVGDVLEVGAGIGGTTTALNDGSARGWLCLEPDFKQAQRLCSRVARSGDNHMPLVVAGSVDALAAKPLFDCILYIDVLEHIDGDRMEIEAAAKLVHPGGHIVVLSPAFQWLFSEFDKSIGHRRRYNKHSLRKLMPAKWLEKKLVYLDSAGILVSLGNVVALRQSLPTHSQIMLWDRVCVPISRALDRLSFGAFGKSILAVWGKPINL
jgi:2-polyprenyl-3-methyl-5-hydroxy-6-metoxy-1,4-benzoquinol methylase